ncbi:MAG: rhodanese-like domain-containing protein [Planctomycetes bacterium]|nr:rhodanese-like domain-containing protein [Planctomycetota bacterium]
MTSTAQITPDMTMEQILAIAPSAQRALFQRYHIGGCSSCAFQPTDTLAQVCKDHNILDVKEVLHTIHNAHAVDGKLQVDPQAVREWIEAREDFALLDLRAPQPGAVAIPGSEPLDFSDSGKYLGLPKERKIVFLCQTGAESLDAAAYFVGHGFTNVFSMRGGADAWAARFGPSAARV